jgi:hypothetical protein
MFQFSSVFVFFGENCFFVNMRWIDKRHLSQLKKNLNENVFQEKVLKFSRGTERTFQNSSSVIFVQTSSEQGLEDDNDSSNLGKVDEEVDQPGFPKYCQATT